MCTLQKINAKSSPNASMELLFLRVNHHPQIISNPQIQTHQIPYLPRSLHLQIHTYYINGPNSSYELPLKYTILEKS